MLDHWEVSLHGGIRGTPKMIHFSRIFCNHPFWGTTMYGHPHFGESRTPTPLTACPGTRANQEYPERWTKRMAGWFLQCHSIQSCDNAKQDLYQLCMAYTIHNGDELGMLYDLYGVGFTTSKKQWKQTMVIMVITKNVTTTNEPVINYIPINSLHQSQRCTIAKTKNIDPLDLRYIHKFPQKSQAFRAPPGSPLKAPVFRRLDLPDALGKADGQLAVRQLRHLQRRGGDDLAQRQRRGALIRQVADVGPKELLGHKRKVKTWWYVDFFRLKWLEYEVYM